MKKKLPNDVDVVDIMTKIQEQLAVLDRKLDSFMTKSLTELAQARAAFKSVQQTVRPPDGGGPRFQEQRGGRLMFRATCADCKKECELPFRPSGDRPVYCQECFSRRKSGNAVKIAAGQTPQTAPLASTVKPAAVTVSQPPAKEKKKPAAAKKSAAKKVVAVRKGKKK